MEPEFNMSEPQKNKFFEEGINNFKPGKYLVYTDEDDAETFWVPWENIVLVDVQEVDMDGDPSWAVTIRQSDGKTYESGIMGGHRIIELK